MALQINTLQLDLLSVDPVTPTEGQVWYNTTEKVLKHFQGATTQVLFDKKTNLAATTNPDVTVDSTLGYEIGSIWVNTTTNQEFVCTSAATGAAIWRSTTIHIAEGLSNQLISGGVAWDSGLTFNVTFLEYTINGVYYTSPATQVVLAAADPTNPRIDVIVADTAGVVSVVTGTPAPSPSKPQIGIDQIEVTFVNIGAGATTPTGVLVTNIYLDNAGTGGGEWDATTNFPARIDVNDTTDPFQGTKDINATNPLTADQIFFDPSGTYNGTADTTLELAIKSKSSNWGTSYLYIAFESPDGVINGTWKFITHGTYGFDKNNTSTYQIIAIPLSAFNLSNPASITRLRMYIVKSGGLSGFFLDRIRLQTGIVMVVGGGNDPNAIHKNVANEIGTIPLKASPASTDVLVIEDSASGFQKKRVTVGSVGVPLAVTPPVDVTKAAAVVGVAVTSARADHKHDITTAAANTITVGAAAAEGAATTLARSDHTHALTAPGAPADVTKSAASAGVATTVARSDHKHDVTTASPPTIGTANAEGTATSLARSDHVHDHGSQTVGTHHAVAIPLGANGFMSGVDKDKLDNIAAGAAALTSTAPVDVTKAAAVVGVGTTAARHDHKHDITTATPVTIGTANAEGTSTSLARADHVHNHGAQTDPTLHAIAVPSGNAGFLSGADKAALDTLSGKNWSTYSLVTSSFTSGTSQPLSITDAVMSGKTAGGSVASSGVAGVVSVSFASLAAETGTGASQGGLGSAASATQPYNSTDFPGQNQIHAELRKQDDDEVLLSDVLAVPPAPADINAKVYGVLSFRSDLGANLKWRLWFYYRRASDGFQTPFTPDISISIKIFVPEVISFQSVPVKTGLGVVTAGQAAAGVTIGVISDIQPVGTTAAGTTGRVADAGHIHAHGNQAGGTLHSLAIALGAAGFMSGADKDKLDNIAAGAAALTSTAPVNVTKAAAVVGVGTTAARHDHKHDITTAAPGTTGVATASGEGSATTLARSDHTHQSNTAPANVTKAAAAIGTSGEPARADHKHDVTTAAPGATGVATASGEGVSTSLARADHTHQSNTAPVNVTKAAAAIGTSGEPARADHKHDVTTAAAVAVGTANAEGTSTSLARADHTHQVTGLTISGQVQGDILYFNGTSWVRLAPGTSGQFLQTQGAAANPIWSSGAAPIGAAYVTIGNDGTLTNERALTGTTNQVIVTDNGPNSTAVLSTPQNIHTGANPTFNNLILQGYLEIPNTSTPAAPTSALRIYVVNEDGFSRLESIGPNSIVLRYGRDQLVVVRNNSGGLISKGDALAIATNSSTTVIRVVKAKADSDTTMPCVGVCLADIPNGMDGYMMTGGIISSMNTVAISSADGDRVFVSAVTAGLMTEVKPAHPFLQQRVGVVINRNASNGVLFVNPAGVRGDQEGTNQNQWKVGDTLAGAKDVVFRNAFDLTLRANPTAARTVTIPDASGTLTIATSTAPVNVTKAAAAVGTSDEAARSDHKHDITTAAAVAVGTANAEGSATTLARSDHTHQVTGLTISGQVQGDILYFNGTSWVRLAPGTSGQHLQTQGAAANPIWATILTSSAPADVTKAAAVVGVSTTAARSDHKHDITTAAPGATGVATASGEGAATTLARSDHTHQSNTAPANVTKAAAAIGTSGEPARADHKHDVTTAAAVAVGTANAEGTSTSLARADHTHQVTGLTIASQAQGDILYFNGTSWVRLPPGTAGQRLQTNGPAANPSWVTASGGGDVVGPASATDGAVALYDGTTGKLIKNSLTIISSTGNVKSGPGAGSPNASWAHVVQGKTTVPYLNGLLIQAGEDLGDSAFRIQDQDNTFGGTGGAIIDVEADQGYVTFFKTYAQTLADRGVVYGIDQQSPGLSSDFNTQFGGYRVAGTLTVANDTRRRLTGIAIPPTPPANNLDVYARNRGGRMLLEIIGPSGIDTSLQPAFFGNAIAMMAPASGATVGHVFGMVNTTAGTVTHPAIATSAPQPLNSMRRIRWAAATTANVAGGIHSAVGMVWRGNAAGLGGFFFAARFAMSTNVAASRAFVGLSALTTNMVTVEPSVQANHIGVGFDSTDSDTGNWFLSRRDGSTTTRVDLGTGMARNVTDVYDLFMFAGPNGSGITVRIVNLSTNTVVLDNVTYTTTIPTSTSLLRLHAACGPASSATSTQFELMRLYVESDL